MRRRFILNRVGTFTTGKAVKNQCKQAGHKQYEYKIRAICGVKLDDDGFIIDHVRIDKAVKRAVKNIDSCEKLCLEVERRVSNTLTRHSAQLFELHITLKPLGVPEKSHAFMEYSVNYY